MLYFSFRQMNWSLGFHQEGQFKEKTISYFCLHLWAFKLNIYKEQQYYHRIEDSNSFFHNRSVTFAVQQSEACCDTTVQAMAKAIPIKVEPILNINRQ